MIELGSPVNFKLPWFVQRENGDYINDFWTKLPPLAQPSRIPLDRPEKWFEKLWARGLRETSNVSRTVLLQDCENIFRQQRELHNLPASTRLRTMFLVVAV